MAKQTINIGASPNDGTGTPLRTAFDYTNQNFTELYTATGPSGNNIVVPGNATITGDLTVDTNVLKVDTLNNRVGVNTATPSYPLHVLTNAVSGRFNLSNIDRTTANWARITNPQYATDASAGLILRPFPDSDLRQGAGIIASGGTNNGDTNVALFVSSGVASSTSFAAYATTIAGAAVSHDWYQSAGSSAMTLNATGLGVKGTTGTSSGDSVIAFGARGVIVGNTGSAIASGSYIDIAVITTGAGYQGFLSVANSNDASANTRTQTTFSVFGRGTSSTITQIATANGSIAGASFTVTTPSNGLIRITNTSGQPTTIAAQFFGATSL